MSRIVEIFGRAVSEDRNDWSEIIHTQQCPFLGRRCYKVRKSDPGTSIGTCTVRHGIISEPIVICPTRLTDRRQIFLDCLHLLTVHEPGNELHVVSEVSIPGGNVDFFVVSARSGRVKDFVGIELQTLDTTGTIWPERQRLLRDLGIPRSDDAEFASSPFGMNWKMTAKTILVQMHHKVQTFEHVGKKLVLVVQDRLLEYMSREFNFAHLRQPSAIGDSMHFHSYHMESLVDGSHPLAMVSRLSTDADGIARCLGLQAEARVELEIIVGSLESKLSAATRFIPL